jgi:AraC-like DNA-binding protein
VPGGLPPEFLLLLRELRFCVKRWAAHRGVTVRTLERQLRRELGRCPREFLRELRMTEAARRLVLVRCAKTVAWELGYSQAAHFTVAFHAYWGVTPCEYLRIACPLIPARQPLEACEKRGT